jgi:DNA-binding transcriptional LysR family regulator
MPSIRQFEVFRALAEHRHFGRAAQALGVTQPALTRSLQKLEQRLGVSLFDRQGMEPTVFGDAVMRFAEPAVGGFAELQRELSLLQGLGTGSLIVAMGPYPADISGGRAAALLSSEHPRLTVALRVCNWSEAVRDVLQNVADLALAELSEAELNADLETEPVRRAQGHFFCRAAHPLARRKQLLLDELLEFPWTGPSYPGRIRAVLPKVDGPFGSFDADADRFNPRVLVETFSMAKEIVLSSNAISAFVPGQLKDELKTGQCVKLPVDLPNLSVNYGFIIKRGRAVPGVTSVHGDRARHRANDRKLNGRGVVVR